MHVDFRTFWQSERVQPFFRAWQGARRENGLPYRQDIQLRHFARFAENLVIHERAQDGGLRYRLAGSMVADQMAHLGPSQNVYSLYADDIKPVAKRWFDGMCDTPCAGVADISAAFINGMHKTCYLVGLPMLSQSEDIMILTLLVPDNPIRVGEKRSDPCFGLDHCVGTFFDIGFGTPLNAPDDILLGRVRHGFYG